jgi:hypothetical protein
LNATYGGDGHQFSLVVVIQDAPNAEYLLVIPPVRLQGSNVQNSQLWSLGDLPPTTVYGHFARTQQSVWNCRALARC